MPETIQEVILTRIDRLAVDAREAIQLASVIGREFTARLLDRISVAQTRLEGVLSELKALELIYEKAYFPELSYMFKHALTHDVAYSTLLEERKRALHRIVAMAIEELYADRLAEQYETLAYHYERAEEWEKATDYLVKAGGKAVKAYANAEALTYFGRALDICERQPAVATASQFVRIAQARATTAMTIGDLECVIADMNRAMRIAQAEGDMASEARTLGWLGMGQLWLHDFETAATTLARARELAEQSKDHDARFSANVFSFELAALLGGPVTAADYLTVAASLADQATDQLALAVHFSDSVFIEEHWRGNYPGALQGFAQCGPSLRATNQTQLIIGYEWGRALAAAHAGEYEHALAMLNSVLEHSARAGEVLFPARALNSIAWVYGELENHEAALDWNQRSFDAGQALGLPDPEIECNAWLNAADSLMALERFDEAEEKLAFVGRVVENPSPPERWMLWRYSQHYFHTLGELRLRQGDVESALMLAERCLRLAEETEARKNVVKARRLLGQAQIASGNLAGAQAEIGAALELAIDVGNPGQVWKTHEAMGDLRAAQHRPEGARASYAAALGVIDEMAAGLTDDDLRAKLLSSANAQRLRELTSATGAVSGS